MTEFTAILRQLSVNQTEDGFRLFCEVMQAEMVKLASLETILRQEVARLAIVMGNDPTVVPDDAYTHPTVLAAVRRLEAELENDCLLIGPALGWLLHQRLGGVPALPPNPLTDRLLSP